MKRTLTFLSAAAVAVTLSACGSNAPADSQAEGESLLSHVQESGVLTVGTEGTYRPFSFHEGNDLVGYDVEITEAVGEKLGVDVEFQETQWDGIFAGLDSERFDVIANQVTINAEREEKYLFSTPYTVSNGVVVTAADNTDITDFASLEGKTTAQSLTSNWYDAAQDAGANVEAVEGWAQAVTLLKQGRVDATINDKLTYLDSQITTPDDSIKIAAESTDQSKVAVALRQDSADLRDAINTALDELRADGTLKEISEKYFNADVTE